MLVGKTQLFSFALGLVTAASIGVAYICLKGSSGWAYNFTSGRLDQNTFAQAELSNLANVTSLPHIFHQSWINSTVPKQYESWRKSWVRNQPSWNHRLWTDVDNLKLVQEQFPWFLSRYESYEEAVMRADSVRYMYMYR